MKHAYTTYSHRSCRWLVGFVCLLLVAFSAHAQSITKYAITGSVTDFNGQPLAGVSIRLSDMQIGTITALDGSYKLTFEAATGNRKLVFSSVGYVTVQENLVLTGNANLIINTRLADANGTLNEVVVIASTISAPKRELGNQISTVKATDLMQSGSGSLLNSLQGKIPGAQITQNSGDPAGGVSVRLRGVKSILGSSDPLYIIDGVIVSNQSDNVSQLATGNQIGRANASQNRLVDLNPNDIESLNVINGAAAAAQYGSRAANGVVLITTKRGRTGRMRVSFSTAFDVNELRKAPPISTFGKQFGTTGLRLHTIGAAPNATGVTSTSISRDGTTTLLATNLVDVTRYNYFDQIFRTGVGTENNVSISGGNENTQYYLSAGYLKNQGIVKGTDFTRYSLRARLDQKLADWAKLSAGMSYANSFSNEKANGNVFYSPINSVNITNNIWDITQRDADGNLKAVEPTRVNPLSTIEDMAFSQAVNRTTGNVQLRLTPLLGMTINGVLGVDNYTQFGRGYIRPYPYQSVAGLPLERYPFGFASNASNQVTLLNADLNIGYERSLSKDFSVNAMVGANYQFQQQDFVPTTGQTLAPLIQSPVGSVVPGLDYRYEPFNISGFFGQATLAYKNLAYLTGAIRQDRSSKFSPAETNQVYPKISGSVVVSDIESWKNSGIAKIINEAKIRASFGAAGNLTGIGSFDRFWLYNPVPYLSRGTLLPSQTLANPLVRPERMNEFETGLDLSFWEGKINMGLTYYSQQINDLIVNRVLAPSEGGANIVNNVGAMQNNGIELSLSVDALSTPDLNVNFGLVFSRNRNQITKLGTPTLEISNAAGAPVFLVEGQPASVFYGFPYARNGGSLLMTAQGLPQRERGVQNGATFTPQRTSEGQPSGAFVRTIIGNPNPDWTGSFTGSVRYKRASLQFLLDAVQGVQVFNADKRTRENVGIGQLAEQEMRGTLQRGYIFSIGPIEEFRVDDGSFVKLRELSLSYELPIMRGTNRVNVSLIGRNLLSFDNYNGFDPETNAGGNADLLRGVDFGNVPIPRTFRLQLSTSF